MREISNYILGVSTCILKKLTEGIKAFNVFMNGVSFEEKQMELRPNRLVGRGIIKRQGPHYNLEHGEMDVVLIHIPTKKIKRFRGNFQSEELIDEAYKWITSFEPVDINSLDVVRMALLMYKPLNQIIKL